MESQSVLLSNVSVSWVYLYVDSHGRVQPSPRPTNPHPDPHVLTRLVFAHWSETCNMRTCRSGGGAFKTQALRVAKKPQEWDMHAFNASRSPHRHHASKATAGSWARSVSWTREFQPAGGSCQSMILRSYCMDVLWALRTGRCVGALCGCGSIVSSGSSSCMPGVYIQQYTPDEILTRSLSFIGARPVEEWVRGAPLITSPNHLP